MTSGGTRNRNGTFPDPNSITSANRGVSYELLPFEGYGGEIPSFPLDNPSPREIEVWEEAWRTPQAFAWAREPWRNRGIALWTRLTVRCEDPEVGAALLTNLHRFSDQIGMTVAGLKENGWQIAKAPSADTTVTGVPKRVSKSKALNGLTVMHRVN